MRIGTFALAAGTVVLIAGCGSDSSTGGTTIEGQGTVTANVDGGAFTASSGVTASLVAKNFTVVATNSEGKVITLLVSTVTGPGDFQLSSAGNSSAQYEVGASQWSTVNDGSSGIITFVTFANGRATGNFSFTGFATSSSGATGSKVVSNGTFDVTF